MERTKVKDFENWTRRDFTLKSVLLILSGVPITIAACGDSDSPSTPSPMPTPPVAPTPPAQDIQGAVSANHGHVATIMAAELTAGDAVSLDITGMSDHPHTVDLTAAEVGQIAQGTRVSATSSNNSSHTHVVTFN